MQKAYGEFYIVRGKQQARYYRQLGENIDKFAAYVLTNEEFPPYNSALSVWYKEHKKYFDVQRVLAGKGVYLEKIPKAGHQARIKKFAQNYFARDCMPGEKIISERVDHEWWYANKDNPVVVAELSAAGIDIHRDRDVLTQEKNYVQWLDFVCTNHAQPKFHRRNELGDPKVKHEDFLRHWQYNIQNDKIECVKYCRVEIKQLVLAKLGELKAEEARIKAELHAAGRRGTGYLRQAAKMRYDTDLREYVVQEP